MKKIYMKPEMQVHQIRKTGLLLTSGKGVYGRVNQEELQQGLKYGGYIDEEEEEEIDPD